MALDDKSKDRAAENGITHTGGLDDMSRVVWSSHDAGYGSGGSDIENIDPTTMRAIRRNGQLVRSTLADGTEVPIWQSARGSTHERNYVQNVIENMLGIKTSDQFVFADTETLGTLSRQRGDALDFFAMTELSLQHSSIDGRGGASIMNDINMVLKPGDNYGKLQSLLDKLRTSVGINTNLSRDERRTLQDLMLYSDSSLFGTRIINGMKVSTIQKQARGTQLLGAAALTGKNTIAKMEAGLENLRKLGTDPATAMHVMNRFMDNIQTQFGGQVKLVGHNFQSFDKPVILQTIENNIGKGNPNSKLKKILHRLHNTPILDTLQIENTLTKTLGTLYDNTQLTTLAMAKGLIGAGSAAGKYVNNPALKGAAHFAPYDVEVNARLFSHQVGAFANLRLPLSGEDLNKDIRRITYNNQNIRVGDRLFAISGIQGYNAGKYDAVYDETGNPLYDIKGMNPLYRNSTYKVVNYADNHRIGKKNFHAMTLLNEDRGTYHVFVRDSKQELQNIIHKNMDFIHDGRDRAYNRAMLSESSLLDASMRRYNDMFSGQGTHSFNVYTRYSKALDAYNEGVKNGLGGAELEKLVKQGGGYTFNGQHHDASDTFYRDFIISRKRFEAEKPYLDQLMTSLDNHSAFRNNPEAKGIAMGRFRKIMDAEFGRNTVAQRAQNAFRSIIPINLEGENINIQVSDDIDAVQRSLSRAVYAGHIRDNVTMNTTKGRLRQIINQLRAQDAVTRTQAEYLYEAVNKLKNDGTEWYILRDIAERINQARHAAINRGATLGLKTIDIETPTQLVASRKQALEAFFPGKGTQIVQKTIEDTLAFTSKAREGLGIVPGSVLDNILNEHDKTMQFIIGKSGLGSSRVGSPTSSRDVISDLLNHYVNKDVGARLIHNGKNGLTLALFNNKNRAAIDNMHVRELLKSNMVTAMQLPILTGDQNIVLGTQRRLARLKAVQTRNNGMRFVTGFEEIVGRYKMIRDHVHEMVLGNKQVDAEAFIRGIGRDAIQSLSMNITKMHIGSDQTSIYEVRKSKASNWLRLGTLDISDFANEWFASKYGSSHPEALSQVNKIMEQNRGMKFVEAMGMVRLKDPNGRNINAGLRFSYEIEDWLKNTYNLNVDSHSIKNTLVNQYVRSFNHAGELNPFHYLNAMARENYNKVTNYMPLEAAHVRSALSSQVDSNGNRTFSDSDIDRMIRRGVTTDRAVEVMGDETNYLSLRSAYMNSGQVQDAFRGIVDEKRLSTLSTYEGMFILRSDIAKAYRVQERKDFALTEGASLNPLIESKLLSLSGNKDLTNDIMLARDQRIALSDFYDGKNKKITIGGIYREMYKNGVPVLEDIYDTHTGERIKGNIKTKFHGTDHMTNLHHMKDTYIVGWDAEKNRLITEVDRRLETGDKMVTTQGHRVTATILHKEAFEAAGMGDIEAILPQFNLSRREYGTQIDNAVQLAYDEMLRAVAEGRSVKPKGLTPGKIALQDGLETLTGLMQKHFGVKNSDITIDGGRIVLNSKLGLSGESYNMGMVYNFMRDSGRYLNTDLLGKSRGFMLGQAGVALADIPKWEDAVGALEEGEEGKVRWGLKERDMINARLKAMAAGDTFSGQSLETSAISRWLNGDIGEVIHAQNPDGRRMSNALTKTILTSMKGSGVQNGQLRPGEVVIRTHAAREEFGLDNIDAKKHGVLDNKQVIHVHANALSDLPSTSKKGGILTVGDYQNTIVTLGQMDFNIHEVDGHDAVITLKQALQRNNGTFLFQLPEGMSHQYIRMIDQDLSAIGATKMPVMKELQKIQSQIWRLTKAYNAGEPGVDLVKKKADLQNKIDDYHEKVAYITSSSRDGGLAKTMFSAKMDMSGRFKIQGISPQSTSQAYEDATAYVSRGRMAQMISGSEREIAEVLGIDHTQAGFKKKVLNKIASEGLYGFVGRYPTIAKDTIQVMKVKIDDTLGKNYQGAMLTVGTATKLKADYDGDFLSTVLAHYKINDVNIRKQVHQELSGIQAEDQGRIQAFMRSAEMNEEINKQAASQKLTVRDLLHQELSAGRKEWMAQFGGLYDVESTQARVNSSLIGFVDNTRYKLLNLADVTYQHLEQGGRIDAKTASQGRGVIEEFGRVLSQDYISSKKFNVDDIRKGLREDGQDYSDNAVRNVIEQRREALTTFIEGVMHPDADGMKQVMEANTHLQLFKDENALRDSLSHVNQIFRYNGSRYDWLTNKTLHLAVSGGNAANVLGEMFQGKGPMAVSTSFMKQFLSNIDTSDEELAGVKSTLERSVGMHRDSVLAGYDAAQGSPLRFGTGSGMLSEEILGSTSAQRAGAGLKDFAGQVFGNIGGRANLATAGMAGAIFGAVWAGSSFVRGGPTPEGNEAQQESAQSAPVPKSMMTTPTARLQQNNENLTINISGKDASNMSHDQLASMIQAELNSMTPMGVNMNLNVNDNTQQFNQQWLQNVVANALN